MKVSFSKIKITPNDYIGMPMAGYSRPDPCLGKLDDIFAYGVLIEQEKSDENNKFLLLLSFDLLKIPISIATYFKEKIEKNFKGIKEKNILIHATHTHSAPDLTGEFHWPGGTLAVVKGIMFGINQNDKFIVWIGDQILKLVDHLLNSLQNSKISWIKKVFNPDIVINRRHPLRKPKPELGVISFKDLDNNIIGLIINYACHPTTLSLFNNKLSADFPGRIVSEISEITNGKTKCIYFNGPAGDLNPITTCGTDYEALKDNKSPIYTQFGTYRHTKKLGFQIAEEALKLAESIPSNNYYENITFQLYIKNILVPLKDPKYFTSSWFQNKLLYIIKKYVLLSVILSLYEKINFPIFKIKKKRKHIFAETLVQYIDFTVQNTTKKRKFTIFTVPGELFEEIGRDLIEESPVGTSNSFLFQNSNDWIAYLFPIKEYIQIGGYEPVASFGPLCGFYIEREMLDFFKDIKTLL
ncbi:MAG: hypothetical protein ACQERB_10375 [Promethearchaeati archaeon]